METSTESKPSKIKKILITILIIGVLLFLYVRYIGTTGLIIKEYPIYTKEIPSSFDGLKIVHFSDVHYGTTISLKELENIVKNINDLQPDIVVFTGDLYDESVNITNRYKEEIINTLKKIKSTLGNYCVSGNHDYSDKGYIEIMTSSGFTYLNSESTLLYYDGDTPIRIEGYPSSLEDKPDYKTYEEDYYTITLIHEPDNIKNLKSNSNLVLAGHSHGGQVRFPLIGALYTPPGSKTYYNEHYKVNKSDLYISYGLGTSLLKLRFFDRPSINLYRFFVN